LKHQHVEQPSPLELEQITYEKKFDHDFEGAM
jgi:hypothetical protein